MFHEKLNVTIIPIFKKKFIQLYYKKDLPLRSAISRYEKKNSNKWNLILMKYRGWVMIVLQRIVKNKI